MKTVPRTNSLALCVLTACLIAASTAAHAQGYHARPVHLVVPTSPGGGTDISARRIAPKLAEYLGQQVVVENRAGANTMIGTEYVARAAPDGYTVLMGISSITMSPYTQVKVPYDPVKDFAPVSQVVVVVALVAPAQQVLGETEPRLREEARTRHLAAVGEYRLSGALRDDAAELPD